MTGELQDSSRNAVLSSVGSLTRDELLRGLYFYICVQTQGSDRHEVDDTTRKLIDDAYFA
jgi:hypothetical protein